MTILIENTDGTLCQANVAQGVDEVAHAAQIAAGRNYKIVPFGELPTARELQDAWRLDTTKSAKHVKTDLVHAKTILHEKRRAKRDEAFVPLDRQATVPALATQAEAARQVIRDADALLQADIDAAKTEKALLALHAQVI